MQTAELAIAPAPRMAPAIRAVLTVLGSILALGFVLVGAYSLLDLAARHSFDERASYTDLRSLVVDAGGGDVHVTGTPAGNPVSVLAHVTEGLATPSREAVREPGGVLRLRERCAGPVDTECDVSYRISVPAGVAVLASSGAGDVTARDLRTSATVRLESGAGDVTATRISAPDVRVSSGAGDVVAQLVSPATRLVAGSGAGDVTLTVPDAVYAVDASSGAGTVSDGSLRSDPRASRSIRAGSGAGDVTIRVSR